MRRVVVAAALLASLLPAVSASGQWTHRYPKVAGYGHHVYLEGYELPILTNGALDAVASPADGSIVLAARGWLWRLDAGIAERLTRSAGQDSRPAFAGDGRRVAFVRDDGADTSIWELDLTTGSERLLVDTPAIDLDPAYSIDGESLYYASAAAGDIDLWRQPLAGGEPQRLTSERGLELRPLPRADGSLVYLAKTRAGGDQLRLRTGDREQVLWREDIASQTRPALSPDGATLVLNVPADEGWRLVMLEIARPSSMVGLTAPGQLPLTPAFSHGGAAVLYSEADRRQRMRLYRVGRSGGAPEEVAIERWSWGAEPGRLRLRTRLKDGHGFVPARLHVADGSGHPAVPDTGAVRFDGQSGATYFYSPGDLELSVPAGDARVVATHGLFTPAVERRVAVAAGQTVVVDLELDPVWEPARAGWFAGDHHFHLNYGGQYRLVPEDLVLPARAEAIDVLTPLTANLHQRFEDDEFWGWRRDSSPLIEFGQEIRSHFLGHLGLIGAPEMFWPWIWGPGYSVYAEDDRPNADALAHVQAAGGVGSYVHPVFDRDPFGGPDIPAVPVELIPDALAGRLDTLEIACLWSSELGTSELWYRLLNLGIAIAPSAGTDAMPNLSRTMAIGATRVYVRTGARPDLDTYLEALRAGRSFVTTGPMLSLSVAGAEAGEVVAEGSANFEIELRSAVPVETLELLVNGEVVWRASGVDAGQSAAHAGEVTLPTGGWVAARAWSPAREDEMAWPRMNSYAFAHTAPIWIGDRGSSEPAARRAAARDLLRALGGARARLEGAYTGVEVPRLRAHFDDASRRLEQLREQ